MCIMYFIPIDSVWIIRMNENRFKGPEGTNINLNRLKGVYGFSEAFYEG